MGYGTCYDVKTSEEVIAGLQGIVDRAMGGTEDEAAAQAAIDLIESLDNHVNFLESELDDAENKLEDADERAEHVIERMVSKLADLRDKVHDCDTSVYLDQPARLSYEDIVNEITRIIGEYE